MKYLSRICLPIFFLFAPASDSVAQSTEVLVKGDTISYVSYGNGRTTLLLVHGWSNTRTFWEPHISTLSEHFRIVTPDLAGFGESTGHRSDWTMASFADDLEAVLESIDVDQVVIVGFSMAGAAAIELAARGRDDIIGVVLADIFLDVEEKLSDEEIDQILRDARADWRDPEMLKAAFSLEASETLIRRYRSRTPEVVPDKWWQSLRNFFVWARTDLHPILEQVHVPIAAINSDRVPTTVDAWQRYAPGFTAHVMPGVNHLGTIWERVDEFDETLVGFVEAFRQSARH